jgi:hypothetical protein
VNCRVEIPNFFQSINTQGADPPSHLPHADSHSIVDSNVGLTLHETPAIHNLESTVSTGAIAQHQPHSLPWSGLAPIDRAHSGHSSLESNSEGRNSAGRTSSGKMISDRHLTDNHNKNINVGDICVLGGGQWKVGLCLWIFLRNSTYIFLCFEIFPPTLFSPLRAEHVIEETTLSLGKWMASDTPMMKHRLQF